MPIHDWTRVPSGIFHDFRQSWSIRLKDALNDGLLPDGVAALVEQRVGKFEGDVLGIERKNRLRKPPKIHGGVTTLERPATHIIRRAQTSMTPSAATASS